jgi:hypothetical protein
MKQKLEEYKKKTKNTFDTKKYEKYAYTIYLSCHNEGRKYLSNMEMEMYCVDRINFQVVYPNKDRKTFDFEEHSKHLDITTDNEELIMPFYEDEFIYVATDEESMISIKPDEKNCDFLIKEKEHSFIKIVSFLAFLWLF